MAASASCLLVVLAALASAASAQLSSTFYDTSCPNALSTIRNGVNTALGGPSWTVVLGRRDSNASFPNQTSDLPPPTSSLQQLLSAYSKKNLDQTDMVALSGAYAYRSLAS
ncbi:unnamed protein product [Miscanthus lutarioriparius]|uniref:Plant heme peroxidase family profile domain-containing protein n=1 Tax=Miscanthus lutarioriparius TaxID=422564 RepID=A0A811NHQ4_9POAL|nr:unnamed protein product [Miscanthus lutarioriparius]